MKIEELQELLEPSKPEKPAKEESNDFGIVLGNHPDNHEEHLRQHVPITFNPDDMYIRIPNVYSTSSIMTFATSNSTPVNWDGHATRFRIEEAVNNRSAVDYSELQSVLNTELRNGNIHAWTMKRDYHYADRVILEVHYTAYSSIYYYL